ncbi:MULTISPECIES: fasciclin domain-containing protein [Chitinophagaceae]
MQHTTKKIVFFSWVLIVAILALQSCQKDSYYKDSGTVQNDYSGTTMDYLREKPRMFDSLVKIIQLAGLEDVLSKDSVTFFAPADSSIVTAITNLNYYLTTYGKDPVTNLAQISPVAWKTLLGMYIFNDKHLAANYPQLDFSNIQAFHGQAYTSYDGTRIMNIGLVYNNANGVQYTGYRQLYLSYIPSLSAPLVGWTNAPVATSDIKTSNGVLHVLQFTQHNMGFSTDFFNETVIYQGINY